MKWLFLAEQRSQKHTDEQSTLIQIVYSNDGTRTIGVAVKEGGTRAPSPLGAQAVVPRSSFG